MPFFLLLFIYTILSSFLFFSILHYPSFPLFYTTLPYRLTYITFTSPIHPTQPYRLSILHYPSCSPSYTLPFLLSTLHYPSFSLPYTTIPSLYPALPFHLLSILHYPSFSLSDTTLPSHYPTLPFLYWSFTTLPSPLHPTQPS